MKKTFYIKGLVLAIIAVIITVQACTKLDLQPLDRVTTDTYYKTPEDFDGAMFAAYSSIQDFWGTSTETIGEFGEYWKLTMAVTDDVEADVLRADAAALDLDRLLIRASDKPYAALYTQIYEGILRANLVIENADKENELTAEQKTQFIAEAKFLRAFFHFHAYQVWGTPPIVLEVKKDLNDLAVGNSTKDEILAAVLSDFQDAYAGLPDEWDDANLGRATKWAAKAFEGKVNVWKEDWPAAITAFEAVRTANKYALLPSYEDAFDFQKENSSESIFEIQFGGPFSDDNLWVFDDTHSEAFKASQGTSRVWYWDPGGDAPGGHMGFYSPSQNLVDEYEEGDPRLEASVYKAGDTYYTIDGSNIATLPYDPAWASNGMSIEKYGGVRNAKTANYSPNGQAAFNNERWYRYAEMLLLYAEALIRSGNAAEGMAVINNEVRARVGMGQSPIADPLKALQHEKRVEMAFEPHRWFDIVRWGLGPEIFGTKWDPKFVVFPFPQSEIDRSGGKLIQNTGY
ncbi:RagB/SusD family nutrient uptake outer membrane protein [Flavihumibacter fluvii]|uniref:RagB/SusD family nutrient uptake outer membrane protein n=1 Tax=Flavihumibacter fluvii TaxID=2838157 RepID=UPI001BDEC03D|nr:RagB/SusD family nutrient uptake outer membrane protein [Flavihumibacter fluvii]ULQ51301.1 RagB/SusD family nutrient uptake outer membrane protein [Flavihumibacter fluvii]